MEDGIHSIDIVLTMVAMQRMRNELFFQQLMPNFLEFFKMVKKFFEDFINQNTRNSYEWDIENCTTCI